MNFDSVENNQDVSKFGHYPYADIEDIIRLAHQSAAEYIFGKTIDILLKKGFQPSEIVDAFADQVSLKFKNSKATMLIEQASSVLFYREEKSEPETTESNS